MALVLGDPEGLIVGGFPGEGGSFNGGGSGGDTAIPAAPTNLTSIPGDNTVELLWTKSSGATGYKVYRDSVLLATIGDVAVYDDDTASNGITYSYTVSATNAGGESAQSDATTATPFLETFLTPGGDAMFTPGSDLMFV